MGQFRAPIGVLNKGGLMASEGTLHVMAQDFKGGNWSYHGTRPEIEAWLEKRGNHADISVIVRDDTNVTVGRKHFGQKEITWGVQLDA